MRAVLLAAADLEGEGALAQLDGVDDVAFAYHAYLLTDAGLAHMLGSTVRRLTHEGHETAEHLRDDGDWARLMDHFRQHGAPEGCGPWEIAVETMKGWAQMRAPTMPKKPKRRKR